MNSSLFKRILPKSLLGRSLLIIVMPLIILQIVSAYIFFENHWSRVGLRLSRTVAGDIAFIVRLLEEASPNEYQQIFDLAAEHMEIVAAFRPLDSAPMPERRIGEESDNVLVAALEGYLDRPFRIDTESLDRYVIVDVDFDDRVLEFITTRKRLFSSTTYIFVLWMVGTSMIVFGVATIFMRNQVKPIRRLAAAADNFGKGRDVQRFKPEGASEVRQAATAFLAMRQRIMRQITQRTEMLAGVSHDLRTPLTRMKLQLAMLGEGEGIAELKEDVVEMEKMLEGYLAFARGEGGESPVPADLSQVLADVVHPFCRQGGEISLEAESDLELPLRVNAFKRCIGNLIGNAARYGKRVGVRAARRGEFMEIVIDDDGPGIPPDKREDVFKPFFRLESSRNPVTGGIGLGLTIARDVVRSHGGEIELMDSPMGGLRVRIHLPR